MPDTRMPHCLYAWQHREQMFAVGHFPILTNSLTLQIFCNIDLYTHIHISSMNASSFVYIDVVIICTMMSFYQQILHSFSCYNVLCIGNLTYAGHFAVCPSTDDNMFMWWDSNCAAVSSRGPQRVLSTYTRGVVWRKGGSSGFVWLQKEWAGFCKIEWDYEFEAVYRDLYGRVQWRIQGGGGGSGPPPPPEIPGKKFLHMEK